jgi:hypothetical protein
MASQIEERVVSYESAPLLYLVSKRDSNERQLPELVQRGSGAQVQIDTVDHTPPATLQEGTIGKAIPPDRAKVTFIDKIEKAILRAEAAHSGQKILVAKEKVLSPIELHQLYSDRSVPAHRYLSGLLSAAAKTSRIVPNPSRWLPGIPKDTLSGVVEEWLSTNESTEYEQLSNIGLDARTSRLTGVVRIKQRNGYLGGPTTSGSREYVAFWVDWGTGFQYEGTTSVAVHDFSSLPSAGLEYKVFLPVDVRVHAQPGSRGAKKVNVRAVLSWNMPLTDAGSCASVVWGNSLESEILIPPGINVSSGARFNTKFAPSGFCLRAIS